MSSIPTLPHRPIVDPLAGHDTQALEQESKKDYSLDGNLPDSSQQEDSESSIDLLEPGTGAVVLPWRVKIPAMICVIFFTCESMSS